MALDDQKAREFIDLFYQLDLDKDGLISLKEIKQGVKNHPEGKSIYKAL